MSQKSTNIYYVWLYQKHLQFNISKLYWPELFPVASAVDIVIVECSCEGVVIGVVVVSGFVVCGVCVDILVDNEFVDDFAVEGKAFVETETWLVELDCVVVLIVGFNVVFVFL